MEQLDKETFIEWMERIMERFDRQECNTANEIPKRPMMDGVPLLDNQDVCQMLHINKRTLQRYRASGTLPFHTMYSKNWYKEVEVQAFMKLHFDDNYKRKRMRKSKPTK